MKYRRSLKGAIIVAMMLPFIFSSVLAHAEALQYTYDDLNRVTGMETLPYGKKIIYQYDEVSNIKTRKITETFLISSSWGSNGTITTDIPRVEKGGNQTFSISPNSGCRIANVLVDGVSVGAITSYTFSNVTSNHTISASFVACMTVKNMTTGNQYSSLQAAYTAASNGNVIRAQWCNYTENITVNRDIAVSLEGGFDTAFSSVIGTTSIKGQLQTTAAGGTLTIKDVALVQ